jgi:muconate cycloisomerase
MASKIETVEIVPLRIPFASKGAGTQAKSSVDVVIVRLRSDDGAVGIGETQAWRRQGSAEYLPNLVRTIEHFFVPRLIGRSPFDIEPIMHDLNDSLFGSLYAQAAVGDALYDLAARLKQISVCELLGGRSRKEIQVGLAILQSGTFEQIAPSVEDALARGYRHLRLKIGVSASQDIANFKAMRQKFGEDIALRADANGAMRFDQALPLLHRLSEYNLEFVEQPVGLYDLDGMAALGRIVAVPLSADESLSSEASLIEIIRRRAASLIQTKSGKNGGLFYCKRLWAIARAAGLAALPGNHPTTSVAATAMAHLCAAWPGDLPVGEFSNGPTDVLADDIVLEPMRLIKGKINLPSGPGLGIELDEDKIKRYRVDC